MDHDTFSQAQAKDGPESKAFPRSTQSMTAWLDAVETPVSTGVAGSSTSAPSTFESSSTDYNSHDTLTNCTSPDGSTNYSFPYSYGHSKLDVPRVSYNPVELFPGSSPVFFPQRGQAAYSTHVVIPQRAPTQVAFGPQRILRPSAVPSFPRSQHSTGNEANSPRLPQENIVFDLHPESPPGQTDLQDASRAPSSRPIVEDPTAEDFASFVSWDIDEQSALGSASKRFNTHSIRPKHGISSSYGYLDGVAAPAVEQKTWNAPHEALITEISTPCSSDCELDYSTPATSNHAASGGASTLSSSRNVPRHKRMPRMKDGYPCQSPECGKLFNTTWELRKHERNVHIAEHMKPFKCDKCVKGFVFSKDLQRHTQTKAHHLAHREPSNAKGLEQDFSNEGTCNTYATLAGSLNTTNRSLVDIKPQQDSPLALSRDRQAELLLMECGFQDFSSSRLDQLISELETYSTDSDIETSNYESSIAAGTQLSGSADRKEDATTDQRSLALSDGADSDGNGSAGQGAGTESCKDINRATQDSSRSNPGKRPRKDEDSDEQDERHEKASRSLNSQCDSNEVFKDLTMIPCVDLHCPGLNSAPSEWARRLASHHNVFLCLRCLSNLGAVGKKAHSLHTNAASCNELCICEKQQPQLQVRSGDAPQAHNYEKGVCVEKTRPTKALKRAIYEHFCRLLEISQLDFKEKQPDYAHNGEKRSEKQVRSELIAEARKIEAECEKLKTEREEIATAKEALAVVNQELTVTNGRQVHDIEEGRDIIADLLKCIERNTLVSHTLRRRIERHAPCLHGPETASPRNRTKELPTPKSSGIGQEQTSSAMPSGLTPISQQLSSSSEEGLPCHARVQQQLSKSGTQSFASASEYSAKNASITGQSYPQLQLSSKAPANNSEDLEPTAGAEAGENDWYSFSWPADPALMGFPDTFDFSLDSME